MGYRSGDFPMGKGAAFQGFDANSFATCLYINMFKAIFEQSTNLTPSFVRVMGKSTQVVVYVL